MIVLPGEITARLQNAQFVSVMIISNDDPFCVIYVSYFFCQENYLEMKIILRP